MPRLSFLLLVLVYILFSIQSVSAYYQYVPPAMAAVNWCNLNPHNCVRTITNGMQNIFDTIDHKKEEIRKQVMFEQMFDEQRKQIFQLGGSVPVDPWKTLQLNIK